MRRLIALSMVLAVWAGRPSQARSQSPVADHPAPLCLRASPKAQCRAYLAVDMAALFTLNSTSCCQPGDPDFDNGRLVWRAGAGFNVGARNTIGVAASLAGHHVSGAFPDALEMTYRRWLNPRGRESFDLSAGFGQAMVDNPGSKAVARGVTVAAAFMPWELFGVTARADFLNAAGKRRQALLAGAQVTSGAVPVVTGLLAVALVIAFFTAGGT